MDFYTFAIVQVYRSCFKFALHDAEAFFDFPSAFVDLYDCLCIIFQVGADSIKAIVLCFFPDYCFIYVIRGLICSFSIPGGMISFNKSFGIILSSGFYGGFSVFKRFQRTIYLPFPYGALIIAVFYGIRNYKSGMTAFEQLSYKEQWYLEKRNAICMTCGRVSPLSTQSTFEDLAVDFEGTTASGAERFYRRTLDKLRLKLLESGVIHTVTLKQTECRKRNKKIAAAVYQYQADNDGEWGELRFDFENGTAEIVKLADWDTVKSNVFAKTAIRYIQGLPEARLLKSVVVPFWKVRA